MVSSNRLEAGDTVSLPVATPYDYDQPFFGRGRFNQLMQQYVLPDFSKTSLHHIREGNCLGVITKIEEWGRCPVWYGRHVSYEKELCAHVKFDGESKPHIVMLCHLARSRKKSSF